MKRIWFIVIGVVALLVVGGGAFYGGVMAGEARVLNDPARLMQQRAGNLGGDLAAARDGGRQFDRSALADLGGSEQPFGAVPGGAFGGTAAGAEGGIVGTVEAVEGDVVIISVAGGRRRVQTSSSTFIEKYMAVDVEALEVGERLVISGAQNDDGSITARSIQSLRAQPTDPEAAQP